MRNILKALPILITLIAILTCCQGCDSVSRRVITFPLSSVTEKKTIDKQAIIMTIKDIVNKAASDHKFMSEPIPPPFPFVDGENNKHECLMFYTCHETISWMTNRWPDHIQLNIINNETIEINIYKLNSVQPSKYLDPVLSDILVGLGKALELYPISFQHDCSSITIKMGLKTKQE